MVGCHRMKRICSWGSLVLCITSVADSFRANPLLRQRRGHDQCLRSTNRDEPCAWIVPENVSFGSLEKLELRSISEVERQRQNPSKTDSTSLCTVSTRAIGLNFADIFCLLGLYAAANEIRGSAAFCPGLEYAGVVEKDPTGTFMEGDRILGFTRFGAYADTVKVPPYFLYPLPSNWTYAQGASFLVQALTAWHGMVEIGQMPDWTSDKQNHVVLVHSAAGGVGLWASEIAARRGAIVIGLVGSDTKAATFDQRIKNISPKSRAMVRGDESSFGRRLSEVLCDIHEVPASNLTSRDPLVSLRKLGYGVDFVMESLGGKYFSESFEAINRGGALVTFGSTSYVSPGLGINKLRLVWRYLTRPRIDPGTLTSRNIRLAGFNLIYLTDLPEELGRQLRDCIRCLSGEFGGEGQESNQWVPLDGVTPPVIGSVFDFREEAVTALEYLKGGSTVGKVVLENSKV